jgi:hypothetical protein
LWLSNQRTTWRKHDAGKPCSQAELTPAQKERLSAISGWWLDAPDTWGPNCALLEEFVRVNGRLPSVKDVAADGTKIGAWLDKQRQTWKAYDAGKPCSQKELTPAQKERLGKIPGWTLTPKRGPRKKKLAAE